MNTQSDIDQRLLRLFPVKVLKDHFQLDGTQAEMLKVLRKQYNTSSVQMFVNQNFGYLKQHVYIIRLTKPCSVSRFNTGVQPFPLGIAFHGVPPIRSYISFPIVKYTGFYEAAIGYKRFEVDFWQPTKLEFIDDYTVVYYAGIIEKNVSAYVEGVKKAFNVQKSNNDDFLDVILKYFAPYGPSLCDFNKGIKSLTDSDTLDFLAIKYKNTYSLTHEVMDGSKTFKKVYPKEYIALISKPIQKSNFRYLKEDQTLIQHFSADPCQGTINVPIFPDHLNQVSNVVTEILRNN